jgi:hypothetical protein
MSGTETNEVVQVNGVNGRVVEVPKAKKGRGRPKGSKNKQEAASAKAKTASDPARKGKKKVTRTVATKKTVSTADFGTIAGLNLSTLDNGSGYIGLPLPKDLPYGYVLEVVKFHSAQFSTK